MDRFKSRRYVIQSVFIVVILIFLVRLFYLQVYNDKFKELANKNVLRKLTIYPSRGLIYDRTGKLIVYNEAVYDVMVTPGHVTKMDTAAFCRLLGISKQTFRKNLQEAKQYSRYRPSIFLKLVGAEVYTHFQEHLYKFPGFYAQRRTIRKYPHKAAAHILGYIGEVNKEHVEQSEYYESGDYIGINGIESSYEEELRGQKGSKYVLVDVHNREQGSFESGIYDTFALAGKDLVISLDIDLQAYGEQLMQNKKGSVVAIEPKTGEVLAFVSSPGYDPNLLTGQERGKNFKKLLEDTLKPLYNRPIMALYPPGSTFKPVMGLIGLEEEVMHPNTYVPCSSGTYYGRLFVGCHEHPPADNIRRAIQYSCNSYFGQAFYRVISQQSFETMQESYNNWRSYVTSFGFGDKLGIDIPNEKGGNIPTSDYYDKIYKGWQWKATTIISLSIGQGEITSTPLQMANMMATLSNEGYYITPHIATAFLYGRDTLPVQKFEQHKIKDVNEKFVELILLGMEDVVIAGTGRVAQIDSVRVGGKTGTAENPHGKDHSLFIAFAPVDDPQIAVAAVVENAGFGSTWAAPIASLMIERYLTGKINGDKRKFLEKRILEANLINPEKERR